MCRGQHLVQHWSATQSTVAVSSGEPELGGICRGASIALGLQSLAADLGIPFKIKIYTDATAAIGICRRRGLGKVRHLAVADLWIQDKMRSKDFVLQKVLGKDNPADLLTKHLDDQIRTKRLSFLNMSSESGRSESAPSLTH